MKIELDTLSGRKTRKISDSLTITGTVIVSGDQLIAEISVLGGQICWVDYKTKEPIGALTVAA